MANTPFECIVSASVFSRVSSVVSKEAVRFYLNGVHVEACPEGGATLVASDGPRLLAMRDPNGLVRGGTAIVRLGAPMMKALTAKTRALPGWSGPLSGKGLSKRLLVVRDQRAAIVETNVNAAELTDEDAALLFERTERPDSSVAGFQWAMTLIDGTFPDWRRVVAPPSQAPGWSGFINPDLLLPIAKALSPASMACSVRLVATGGAMDPVLVFPARGDDGVGVVIMPQRNGDVTSAPQLPAWLSPSPAIAAE